MDNRVLIPPTKAPPPRPPGDKVWSLEGETMGTSWAVKLVAPPGLHHEDVRTAVQAELDAVVAVFSPWEPRSEISRFNAAPPGVYAVSTAFWDLLNRSLDLGDETDGAVDPTLGALVDLWGFGPPGPRPDADPIPSDDAVSEALAVSGWQALRLNRQARGVMQMGGMKLDFSGIAKGHAVDRVSERLTSLGATSHLVEVGGELRGAGVKPDGQPWWVEIHQPPGGEAPRTVAAMLDIAVATSGDYVRAFSYDGRLYPHTIDGRTGRPVDNDVVAVTVFHASAMMADAYATALFVMGADEGSKYAAAINLAACITARGEDGALVEHMTVGFAGMTDEAG